MFPPVPHFVSGRAPVALRMGDGFDVFVLGNATDASVTPDRVAELQQTPVVDMHTLVH